MIGGERQSPSHCNSCTFHSSHSEDSSDPFSSSSGASSSISVSALGRKNSQFSFWGFIRAQSRFCQLVPVLFFSGLPSFMSHLSSLTVRILLTCGCLAASIKVSSSELLLEAPERKKQKYMTDASKENSRHIERSNPSIYVFVYAMTTIMSHIYGCHELLLHIYSIYLLLPSLLVVWK